MTTKPAHLPNHMRVESKQPKDEVKRKIIEFIEEAMQKISSSAKTTPSLRFHEMDKSFHLLVKDSAYDSIITDTIRTLKKELENQFSEKFSETGFDLKILPKRCMSTYRNVYTFVEI